MASIIPGFPESPQHSFDVVLLGATYRLTFTWRERTQGWYLDIHDENDTPVRLGRRLSPGWGPLVGVTPEVLKDVLFVVLGEEPYAREDLGGDKLRLLELPLSGSSTPAASSDLTATIEA